MTAAPRAYIALPMSGIPDWNEPLARRAADYVRTLGYDPLVPHDIEPGPHEGPCPQRDGQNYPGLGEHTGHCYLRADLREMLSAVVVFAAPGWENSYGASVEIRTAEAVGIPVFHLPDERNTERKRET